MHDHTYIDPDGREYKVSEMPLEKIHYCLAVGVTTQGDCEEENVLERLRIELIIRGLDSRK